MKNKITIGDSGIYQIILLMVCSLFFILGIFVIIDTNVVEYQIAAVFWLVLCPVLIPGLIHSYITRSFLEFSNPGLIIKHEDRKINVNWENIQDLSIFFINHKGLTEVLFGIKFHTHSYKDFEDFNKKFFKINKHFAKDLKCDLYISLSKIYKNIDLNPLFGVPNQPTVEQIESEKIRDIISDFKTYFDRDIKIKNIIT